MLSDGHAYSCRAAVLDDAGMLLKTCLHDHGNEPHAAMSCALALGYGGAVEFKIEKGRRVRTLQRWRVWKERGEQRFRLIA